MKLDVWFPPIIGSTDCPFIDKIQDKYKKIIKKYPAINKGFINYPVHQDKRFKKLNDWISHEVNAFSKEHRFIYSYEAKESWAWDYQIGAYQGSHTHLGHTLSATFFLEGYPKDTPLTFINPIHDMKNPLGVRAHTSFKRNIYNSFTFRSCSYAPRSGLLLIWRSYIEHSVDVKYRPEKRIVFVYNFDPI